MDNIWTIQVLTPDYLLEGTISTSMLNAEVPYTSPSILEAYYHPFGYDNTIPLVRLTFTQVQPASNLPAPATSDSNWVINGDRAVAFIPKGGASNAHLLQRNTFQSLVAADLVIGSFLIQGTVWSPEKQEAGLSFLKKCSRFVIQDVIIDQQLPGSNFPRLEVPYAVLCTFHLQCAALHPA